jgi:photosystem II stability/assembly factor-like uncharacterized protein
MCGMPRHLFRLAILVAFVAAAASAQPPHAGRSALRYRNIGPFRGGRVTAVAGHRGQLCTFYMGATGGGVWKTTDCGATWHNVSDGFFATGSIGAIAVAESDPGTIYVGTGSAAIRSNVIQGRGVYKSTDAGKTWTFIGLPGTGQIGAVRVHPRAPDVAYVAALGQPFGPNPDRGVFRTRDGGATWQKVLYINDRTGAVSLALSPGNPDVIFAGAWRGERKPWTIISGGPASETGLYMTADGGDTWSHVTKGLPTGLIGKIDIDIPAADPQRVYVILEAAEGTGGLYRSDDGGQSFSHVNGDPQLIARPFYYTYVDADPKDRDVVWVNNLALWKSDDAGRTFRRVAAPHGDMHGMWINPDNPAYMIQSNDGGANVSVDGGASWSTQYNQSTAEIYQVEVDDQFPYRVYGAQQDNSTVIVPSAPPIAGRTDDPVQLWMQGPGCETGPIKPNPANARIVYGVCKGEFSRLNLDTGQESHFWVYPQNRYGHNPRDVKYRFQRTSPFEISPHDPKVIYHGSHVVHRTTDEGYTWEVISPDLTANEPDKQVISGEPITRDVTGEEVYSTIFAIEESPAEPGVIWVGANDGPVHITRDAGRNWTNVTPKGLPPGGRVQNIEPSPHRKGSAYVVVNRSQLDDWQPYIYRSDDYGVTWTRISDGGNGIPKDHPARVVREDPDREGLLYAGTEFGMFVSADNGRAWRSLQLNLPVTPVTDARIHRKDLVISTMGRGFWVLDNVTPLHQPARTSGAGATPRLLPPREAVRARWAPMSGRPDQPEYPAASAEIDYVLESVPSDEITIEVLNADGEVVRGFSTAAVSPERSPAFSGTMPLDKRSGLNRLVWDMRAAGAWDEDPRRIGRNGPHVPPGRYQVRLRVGNTVEMRPLVIAADPRLAADGVTAAHLQEQYDFNRKLVDAISRARRLASAIKAHGSNIPHAPGSTRPAEDGSRLRELETRLVTAGGPYPQPMLIDQLQNILRMTSRADQRIGRDAAARFEDLSAQLGQLERAFTSIRPAGSTR